MSINSQAVQAEAAALGITELQSYRRARAREEIARSRVVRSVNFLK